MVVILALVLRSEAVFEEALRTSFNMPFKTRCLTPNWTNSSGDAGRDTVKLKSGPAMHFKNVNIKGAI